MRGIKRRRTAGVVVLGSLVAGSAFAADGGVLDGPTYEVIDQSVHKVCGGYSQVGQVYAELMNNGRKGDLLKALAEQDAKEAVTDPAHSTSRIRWAIYSALWGRQREKGRIDPNWAAQTATSVCLPLLRAQFVKNISAEISANSNP